MFFDIIGWVGAILVLLAYMLLSTGKLKNGLLYQLLNLAAGICMAIGLFPKNAWFSFAVQVVWALVAIFAIAKIKMTKKR